MGQKRTEPRNHMYPLSFKQKAELELRRKVRSELLRQAMGRCQRCGEAPDWRGLQLHHLIHLSKGGKTSKENCQLRCAPCYFGVDGHRTEGRKGGKYEGE